MTATKEQPNQRPNQPQQDEVGSCLLFFFSSLFSSYLICFSTPPHPPLCSVTLPLLRKVSALSPHLVRQQAGHTHEVEMCEVIIFLVAQFFLFLPHQSSLCSTEMMLTVRRLIQAGYVREIEPLRGALFFFLSIF